MGATDDTSSYTGNTVTITYSMSAGEAGNDDESGTLRVHKDDFALYNIDIKNTVCCSINARIFFLSDLGLSSVKRHRTVKHWH